MAKKSLPERTLDLWVACAINDAFPNALIWAPTQNDIRRAAPQNWDAAAELAGSKTVLLENKATVASGPDHRIEIDKSQLERYLAKLDADGFDRLFYVLPSPPWQGNHGPGPVPAEAANRSNVASWAHVFPACCLMLWLDAHGRNSVNTKELQGPPQLTCPVCRQSPWSLDAFLKGLAGCWIIERSAAATGPQADLPPPPPKEARWDAVLAKRHRTNVRRLIDKRAHARGRTERREERPAKDIGAPTLVAATIPAEELAD